MATAHLRFPFPGTGVVTSVPGNLSSVTILAANANRLGAVIYNRSNSRLFLLVADTPAAATLLAGGYTDVLDPNGEPFVIPNGGYTGIIRGIWQASVSGFANITEWSP